MPDLKTALSDALARQFDGWEEHENAIRNPNHTQTQEQPQTQPQQENKMVDQVKHFSITNNVMRATFNYIRDNAGKTRKEVIAALEKQGYLPSSTASVVSQLMRSKQVHKNFDGSLHARGTEYEPIKQSRRAPVHPRARISKELADKIQAHRRITTVRRKKAATQSEGIAALPVDTSDTVWKPEHAIASLNVMQARQVYDYLKQLFGG